jgi:hypothetical protein
MLMRLSTSFLCSFGFDGEGEDRGGEGGREGAGGGADELEGGERDTIKNIGLGESRKA